jgi:hypothetical protein
MDKIYLKDNYIVTELSGVTAVFGKNYTVYSENTTTFFLNSSFPINNARSVTIDFSRSSTIFNEAGTVAYTTATLRSFFLANTGFKSPVGGSTGITVGTTPITSGVDGRVLFQSGGVVSQDSGFFWDNTNKRLGVGTSTPSYALHVSGIFDTVIKSQTTSNSFSAGLNLRGGVGSEWSVYTQRNHSSGNVSPLVFKNSINNLMLINTNGNVGIGTVNPQARLDVRAQGALSTDIAFRVRNNADTRNFLVVNGAGDVFNNGAGGVTSNTFYGENSGRSATGDLNTFFGASAGRDNTTGLQNAFFGQAAGQSNTTGGFNSFFGRAAGSSAIGSSNVYLGMQSGQLINGSSNISIGRISGRYISSGASLSIAQNSIFIGYDTRANADNQTNQIVIGHNATGLGSNTVVLGNTSIVTTQLRGTVRLSLQASAPAGVEGAIYYDSTTKKHYGHDGTTWNALY